ncbi:MAG: alpha-amylase [Rhodospirillales bacterium]|nr:alpha-amylase [Rhodospirillales bacterium]
MNNSQWWKRAVIYEIAAVSFQDSNGDGKGDLPGLKRRIEYIRWLGVDTVWLTPIFRSPFLDLGYDIVDFCSVDPTFGTLDDFDQILTELHNNNIHLILDFVPNHTSDRHAWFGESRSSRSNPRHDWYIWADPAPNGGPPNNWLSRFGGSAWEWDEGRRQYYYHSFLVQQPDLNWRCAEVRAAMFDVMRFWLRRGVDGFRVDASAVLIKDDLLRDNPKNQRGGKNTPPPERLKPVFTDDRPETMDSIENIRAVIDEFGDRVLAGEVQGEITRIGHFYGNDRPRFHLPLNFALIDSEWDALSLQAMIDAYLNAIPQGAWPDWIIGGHDKKRIASQIGQPQARILAMLFLTLKGTPFFFAGDEIGMEQVAIPDERVRDPFEKLVGGYGLNRDPERSPMPWDHSSNGGFSSGEPWLPMGDIAVRNVEMLKADERSLLWLYRRLIGLRHQETILSEGAYEPLRSRNDVLAYKRVQGQDEMLVLLNLAHEPRQWEWQGNGTLLLSTHLDRDEQPLEGPTLLRSDEGLIIRLAQ